MLIRISSKNPCSGHGYNLLSASIVVFVALLATSGCATEPERPANPTLGQRTTGEVVTMAQQPLQDINVLRGEIPPVLLKAKADPYAPPITEDCQSLIAEIQELDYELGADLDLDQGANPSSAESPLDMTFALARSTAAGLLPYREVARQVTGAERRSREINEAVLAGTVRRAYLKGIGGQLGCEYPGSPRQQERAISSP